MLKNKKNFFILESFAILTFFLSVFYFYKLTKSCSSNLESSLYILNLEIVASLSILFFIFMYISLLKGREKTKLFSNKAFTDALTKAYNRTFLDFFFKENIVSNYVFVIFDVDHFKKVNDNYGHDIGDVVLKTLVKTAQSTIRANSEDFLVRWGGEEFLLILKKNNDSNDFKNQIKLVERVRQTIKEIEFFNNQNEPFKITASYGINFIPEKCETIEEAVSIADKALYKAKINRDEIVYFTENDMLKENIDIEKIKSFLSQDRLFCQYQQITNVSTEKIIKYESYSRFLDFNSTVFSPESFLYLIRSHNMQFDLIKGVFEYNSKVLTKNKEIILCVNLSAFDICNDIIFEYLRDYKVLNRDHAERIFLELGQVNDIADLQEFEERLSTLKHNGYSISLDNFGEDYSKLTYLLLSLVDEVKISGSLIRSLKNKDSEAFSIITSLKKLTDATNTTLTASHIESKDILSAVVELGIENGQGFIIEKPINLV